MASATSVDINMTDTNENKAPTPSSSRARSLTKKRVMSKTKSTVTNATRSTIHPAAILTEEQQSPPPPPPIDYSWSIEEHEALLETLWAFGIESITPSASSSSSSPPSSIPTLMPLRLPTLLSTKDPHQISTYLHLFLWDLYASFTFVAPLLSTLLPTFDLERTFLEGLIKLHHLETSNDPNPYDLTLVCDQLYLPHDATQQGFPLVTIGSSPHLILVIWVGRLRRLSLLQEWCHQPPPNFEGDPLTELDRTLLVSTQKYGYGKVEQLPSDAQVHQLDSILDAFQRNYMVENGDEEEIGFESSYDPTTTTTTTATTTTTSSTPSFDVPSHKNIILTSSLLRHILKVLQQRGLPLLPFETNDDSSNGTSPHTTSSSLSSPTSSFLPFVDWSSLNLLLGDGSIDWRLPVEAALLHLSGDFERTAIDGLTNRESWMETCRRPFQCRKDDADDGQDRVRRTSYETILPLEKLHDFRRCMLFWHRLNVRLLSLQFHHFTSSTSLLEWFSQYAPGLLDVPTEDTFQNISVFETTILQGASIHGPPQGTMPNWWQIGLHDLCLLKLVQRYGLEPKVLFHSLNEEIRLELEAPSAAASATANNDNNNSATSSPPPPPSTTTTTDSNHPVISWNSSTIWLNHSRPIIRQRMGVSDTNDDDTSMPRPELITEQSFQQVMRRIGQLVSSLSHVAADEFMNRLLQSVEVTEDVTSNLKLMSSLDASHPPLFTLSPSASRSYRYYIGTIPCLTGQADLYGLLKTRFHELRTDLQQTPSRQYPILQRRNEPGGCVPPIPLHGESPLNPLKAMDAAFLRPTIMTLSQAQMLETWSPNAITCITTSSSDRNDRMDTRCDDEDDEEEYEDDDIGGGGSSRLLEMIERHRRKDEIKRMMNRVCGITEESVERIEKLIINTDGSIAKSVREAHTAYTRDN